jgi:hypothetical protein
MWWKCKTSRHLSKQLSSASCQILPLPSLNVTDYISHPFGMNLSEDQSIVTTANTFSTYMFY